ncbi:MAG TPA: TonB-dependent receptor [Bryobacteraceae bacterium]|nr:TonB-dependent receptor [Bryobacteraceae bacterium]
MPRSAAVSIVFLLALPAFSQEFRASVTGQVTDSTGAIVPGANLTITSIERNDSVHTLSNSAGRYVIEFLLPGHYTLTVEKAGFKKYVHAGLQLDSADRLSLDVALEVGELTQNVTVTGESPLLETETASRGSTIENRVIENVPTNGRNIFTLQYEEPGVIKQSTYWGSMELWAYSDVNGVSINGGRNGENETLVDGVSDTNSNRSVSLVPALSGAQEAVVQSNIYDAQFGRFGGGVTSIAVKSGTNLIHGEVYEFLKNIRLDATEWVLNALGTPRTRFQNNTFGFETDGPIYIPKVINGKNRVFFMFSYEGAREHLQSSAIRTMPTPAMRTGDFSNLFNNAGQQVLIYDPKTQAPFPGNIIPSGRINPIAAKLVTYYPQPTGGGTGPAGLNNYSVLEAQVQAYTAVLGKVDFVVSPKSHISFRYGQTPWNKTPSIVWGNNVAEPAALGNRTPRNWGADWTYTITPSILFNLRGGLSRYENFSGSQYGAGFDPRQLGFPSSLVSQFSTLQFPRFNLGTYSELGGTAVKNYETDDTWSLQPNMSWVRGKQTLKFGTELRRYNQNFLQPGAADGNYTFGKTWTQANPLRADATSGNEFATFLLGLPTSGTVDRNIDASYRNMYYALFAQDDWKITPRLTLNLGVRWDYEAPRTERYNRMVRGFAFGQPSPIAGQVSGLDLTGGLLYAGTDGDNRFAFLPDRKHIEPRFGVAWSFAPKWVMRGGYGLSYLGQNANGPNTGFSQPTTLIASTDGGLTPAVSLSDPFPASLFPTGLLVPIGSSRGLATNLGQSISAQYLDRPLPYSQQYSFGFQRELRGGWLVDTSYSGNQTSRLPVSLNLNFIPLDALNSQPVSQRVAYFTAAVPNPMAGLLPSSSINGATVPRQQLLYAYPQFTQVQITNVPVGSARYDSFQSKVTHRFAHGLSMQGSFTISKNLEQVSNLNAQDVSLLNLLHTSLEKRLTAYDAPRSFVLVTSYQVPFGRGMRFGKSMPKVLNAIAGNWNVNAQWSTHSGFPFAFPNAAPLVAQTANLHDSQRDALAQKAGRPQFDPSLDVYFNTDIFPTQAQAPDTLRTFPTMFPDVRSKILNVWDMSVSKEIPIKERLRWQVRADFHNAFNHPWFGNLASNNVTNADFGKLSVASVDDTSEPRLVVLVMKVVF